MFYKFDITVHPTLSEPINHEDTSKKLHSKYKFPWRINMLARPKPPLRKKYEPPPLETVKVFGPIDPNAEFRCDHLARPTIRKLNENIKLLKARGPKYIEMLKKALANSWNSIYNYYRKRLRARARDRLKRKLHKLEKKKPTGKALAELEKAKQECWAKLSTPKKVPEPEIPPRKWKTLDELLANIDVLATPRHYEIEEPKPVGYVNPTALIYEITENILKLAQIPERMKKKDTGILQLGAVKPSALRAKCTERIDKLAIPSFSAREARKSDEDKYDPWVISPNALKYKPTARILELAKPSERE